MIFETEQYFGPSSDTEDEFMRLFLVMRAGLSQSDIESKHRSVDIDAIVIELRLRQISVRDVHVVQASRKGVLGVDVIADASAHVVGKRKILPLCPHHPQWFFRIDNSCATALFKIGHRLPVAINKIAADTEIKSVKMGFWSSGNGGDGSAESEIRVAAEDPSPANIGHMPAQGRDDRHESISEPCHVVAIADGKVVDEWNVNRMVSNVEAEFRAIPVINIEVTIGTWLVLSDHGRGSAYIYLWRITVWYGHRLLRSGRKRLLLGTGRRRTAPIMLARCYEIVTSRTHG